MNYTMPFYCCIVIPFALFCASAAEDDPNAGKTSPERIGTVRVGGTGTFDLDTLYHDGAEQWRWLSVPHSRLVLNPSLITERSTPLCNLLALHVGHWHGAHPERLQGLAAIRVLDAATVAHSSRTWHQCLTPNADWISETGPWIFEGATAQQDNDKATIAVEAAGDPWGHAALTITPPFPARAGFIRISAPDVRGAWALKIGHEDLPVDAYVQHDTQRAGVYTYDLTQVDGWRDRESFEVKFFAVGDNAAATLASLEIALHEDDPDMGRAATVDSCWHPHQLSFAAQYETDATHIAGRDFFHDEDTIVRLLDVHVKGDAPAVLRVEGHSQADPGHLDEPKGAIAFQRDGYAHALALTQQLETGYAVPEGFAAAQDGFRWWFDVPLTPGKTRLAFTVSFATGDNAQDAALQQATQTRDHAAGLAARKTAWREMLGRVPAPEHFGITDIDAKGVTAAEHRRAYYAAWTFVLQNVLPPMPENAYPYPQTPTGKPSLWSEGASKARASAAWESFFAQQLLVHIDPDTAWDAFEGMMMQVDADGWLDGEVLPSRKAETAWVLYSNTGDRTRLEKVYPPISRYLRWREKNPRWIYRDHDNPHQRDSNFVDSLLLDLHYAKQIATRLGLDADEWRAMGERVTEAYLQWFFPEEYPHPVQYYYKDTNTHDAGHATWVCSGLYLDGLPDWADEALMELFLSMYDPARDLAGLDFYKHPVGAMISHGLLRRGLEEKARGYMQAVLRDIIRATRFSENYSFEPLRGWGVEDSMFGAATVIEFTLMLNGMRIDGPPAQAHTISNISPQ